MGDRFWKTIFYFDYVSHYVKYAVKDVIYSPQKLTCTTTKVIGNCNAFTRKCCKAVG